MTTKVVHIEREPYDVYIGRGSQFAAAHGGDFLRRDALKEFAEMFAYKLEINPNFKAAVLRLKGKTLGCHCKPKACHGDIIAAWVDAQPDPEPSPVSADDDGVA